MTDDVREETADTEKENVVTEPDSKAEEKAPKQEKKSDKEKSKEEKKFKAECEKHQKELDKLHKELEEQKDKYLRMMAEYDNFRRRAAKERESVYSDAYCDALEAVLPVIDNLERAASYADADAQRCGIHAARGGTTPDAGAFARIADRRACA